MKRFLALIAAFLFLFVMISPVISLAAQNPNSFVSAINGSQLYYNTYVINSVDSDLVWSIGFQVENHIGYVTSALYAEDGIPCIAIHFFDGSPNSTVTVKLQYCNLISGDIYYETYSRTLNSQGKYDFYRKRQTCPLPVYYFVYQSFDTINQVNNSNLILVDQFVYFPIIDGQIIYSSIPKPIADSRHFYIADSQFLYEIVLPLSDNTYFYSSSSGDVSDSGYYVTYNINDSGLHFFIRHEDLTSSPLNYNAYLYRFILSNGELVDYQNYTSNSLGNVTIDISLSSNLASTGLWFSSFIMDYAPNPQSKLNIVWGESSFIHSDFLSVNAILNSILSDTSTIDNNVSSIDSRIAETNTRLNGFATLCNEYFTWFKQTYYRFTYDSWTYQLDYLTRCYNVLTNVAGCLRIDMLPLIQDIRDTLVSHTETQPDTSAFDDSISEYEEGESYVVNQAEVALDNLESQMSGAADVLTVNSRGLLFVKNIFETFAFSGMNYYYILFVLVLGSVALLIGRRLR